MYTTMTVVSFFVEFTPPARKDKSLRKGRGVWLSLITIEPPFTSTVSSSSILHESKRKNQSINCSLAKEWTRV